MIRLRKGMKITAARLEKEGACYRATRNYDGKVLTAAALNRVCNSDLEWLIEHSQFYERWKKGRDAAEAKYEKTHKCSTDRSGRRRCALCVYLDARTRRRLLKEWLGL